MNGTCLIFGILFLGAGIAFFTGKAHVHMKAWKRMPEEEKAGIRIVPLCRNIGMVIGLAGLVFLASGISASFKSNFFTWGMIAWMVICGADLIFIEKSGRYKRD